jgi:glucans biosynthesis protein C
VFTIFAILLSFVSNYLGKNIFALLVRVKELIGNNFIIAGSIPMLYFTYCMYVKDVDMDLPNASFTINEYYFFYYFYFYVFGWLIYRVNFKLSLLKKNAELKIIFALVLTILRGKIFLLPEPFIVIGCSLTTWCYVFGLIGFVQIYFDKKSTLLRYLSDSSYWVYLVHFPILLFLKLAFPENHSFIGFLVLLSFQFFLSILTYHYFVRPTFIGQLLNGKKRHIKHIPELKKVIYSKHIEQRSSVRLVNTKYQRKKSSIEL